MNTTYIWTDPARLGGKPCLRNHCISVAQLLSEIAEADRGVVEVAVNFDLSPDELRGMIEDVGQLVNQMGL